MKWIGIAAALVLIGAAAFFFVLHGRAGSTRAPCASASPQPVIVAFGDSLVAGYGATSGHDLVSDLVAQVRVPIRNLGVSGNTTADGLARVDSVVALHPDIVILLLGGNDVLEERPVTETEANLDAIMQKLTAADARIVLVGVPGGIVSDPFPAMYLRLAAKYHAEYVSNILSGLLGHSDLMSDEIHPNDAGYAKAAARILPALERECAAR
jgi:acyl-CoA thioesterase-1